MTLPNAPMNVAGLVATEEVISAADSGAVQKTTLGNAGVMTLPNTSISAVGVLLTKGNIFVTDSSGNEKVQLSNAGAVTSQGILSTKGGFQLLNSTNTVLATVSSTSGVISTKGTLFVCYRFCCKRERSAC